MVLGMDPATSWLRVAYTLQLRIVFWSGPQPSSPFQSFFSQEFIPRILKDSPADSVCPAQRISLCFWIKVFIPVWKSANESNQEFWYPPNQALHQVSVVWVKCSPKTYRKPAQANDLPLLQRGKLHDAGTNCLLLKGKAAYLHPPAASCCQKAHFVSLLRWTYFQARTRGVPNVRRMNFQWNYCFKKLSPNKVVEGEGVHSFPSNNIIWVKKIGLMIGISIIEEID